ncbi:MAG: FAD-binding oxidoreductase [Gammaproteobacteria bacterium]|nr:MAG: FAD-binding oxidoreductase [Gammaproteobacteria bacterium]
MRDPILAEEFSETPLWWQDRAPLQQSAPDHAGDADVVIVGSGYAGLSCAHELARGGLSVIVVDAGKIGSGASTRNAGFLSGRAGVSKQIDLEALVGKANAGRIFDEADAAYDYLRQLVVTENIDCSLATVGRYVAAHTPKAYDRLAAKMREYNSDGSGRFFMVPRAEQHDYVDSDYWYGGMFTESAGLIHPSRYHRGLVDLCLGLGVTLVSDNRVVGIVDEDGRKRVVTEDGSFGAREVVLATNGYTDTLSPWHQSRLIPISSTVVASEEIGVERVDALLPKHCAVIDTKRVICWARPSPDRKRLLFGGRARFSPLGPLQSARILHRQLSQMFPQMSDLRVTNAWSGYMAFTFDFMPKIGIHDGIHYAIGCNGGCGIVMMSWLGRRVGQKILGSTEVSAFEGLPFRTQPFYSGKPWFLPIVGNWWRLRDWLELRQAKKA